MPAAATGIVLRRTTHTSSTAVVTIYTRELGIIAAMIRGIGAKRSQSALFQPLQRLELEFDYRPGRQIQYIQKAGLASAGGISVSDNPSRLAVMIFLAEVLYKVLKEESPDEELFDFISSSLDYFDHDSYNPEFHIVFLLRLTKFFGFYPDFQRAESAQYFDLLAGTFVRTLNDSVHTADAEASRAIFRISQFYTPVRGDAHLTHAERQLALAALLKYYQLHVEGFGELKSYPILMEIFSA